MRPRDNQRSRVYEWEQAATANHTDRPRWTTLEEVETWLRPIWRAERGRVGLARQVAPTLSRNLWGQRRATASSSHELKLPKWARTPWVVLHEAAHRLTPRDEAHGPRFVGVLIGLVCRHDGRDADELMALADEHGVDYYVRSIGLVPVLPLSEKVARILPLQCEVEAAIELGVHWRQIRGAALVLERQGRAKWFRGRLVATGAQ